MDLLSTLITFSLHSPMLQLVSSSTFHLMAVKFDHTLVVSSLTNHFRQMAR